MPELEGRRMVGACTAVVIYPGKLGDALDSIALGDIPRWSRSFNPLEQY